MIDVAKDERRLIRHYLTGQNTCGVQTRRLIGCRQRVTSANCSQGSAAKTGLRLYGKPKLKLN